MPPTNGPSLGASGAALLALADENEDGVISFTEFANAAAKGIQGDGKVQMCISKEQFDATCAVHPSVAEELVTMKETLWDTIMDGCQIEVEVGYINKESGVFRKLTENEIDNVLTDLADKN